MQTREENSMTNRFMMSVAAVALIAGTGFASAQGMGGREGGAGGGAGGGAPAAAQQSAPSSGSGSSSSTPMNRDSATESKGADSKGADKGGMKSTQSDEKMAPGATKNQRAQDDMKAGEKGKSAQDNNLSGDRAKGGMNSDKAEGRDSKTGNTNNAQTDSKSGNMNNAQTKSPADTKSQTTGNAATSATAAPPAEKRTQIVSAIKSEKIEETTNVNFNISVGTRVPTNVRFHPLPSRIVEIYPEWRGYDVIFIRGQYIIVRPETHEIVYIIEG
jgi:Protein of unknown function (DUF1236)